MGDIYGRSSWKDFVEEEKDRAHIDDPANETFQYLPSHLNGVLFAPIPPKPDMRLTEEEVSLGKYHTQRIKEQLQRNREARERGI